MSLRPDFASRIPDEDHDALRFMHLLSQQDGFQENIVDLIIEGRSMGFPYVMFKNEKPVRTLEEQQAKVDAGVSQTLNSQHRAGTDGLARAVDIVHERYAWNVAQNEGDQAARRFWLTLGHLAIQRGLGWGGLFFKNRARGSEARAKEAERLNNVRTTLRDFLQAESARFNPDDYTGPLGWDLAHVQLEPNSITA